MCDRELKEGREARPPAKPFIQGKGKPALRPSHLSREREAPSGQAIHEDNGEAPRPSQDNSSVSPIPKQSHDPSPTPPLLLPHPHPTALPTPPLPPGNSILTPHYLATSDKPMWDTFSLAFYGNDNIDRCGGGGGGGAEASHRPGPPQQRRRQVDLVTTRQ